MTEKPIHQDIYGNKLNLPTTNWALLEQLMGNLKIVDHLGKELMTPYDVVKDIFELTSQYYNIKYVEEQAIRIKYEGRLIDRRAELTGRDELIKSLTLNEADTETVNEYYKKL